MRLKEIMRTEVATAEPTESAETAWQRMRMRRIRHLVVLDNGEVVGVVSDRDLGGPDGVTLRHGRQVVDVMTAPVVTAEQTTTVRKAANLMRGTTVGCLPVLDRGKVAGIVTTTDLLTLLGKGAERPSPRAQRAIMKGRGPRRKPFAR